MKIVFIIIGIVVLLIIVFMIYRYFAFRKESAETHKLRFERIHPLYENLENGNDLNEEEVLKYAQDNKTREVTYQILSEHNKAELFPKEFLTIESGAESNLVNWLEFPTELDKAPDDIKHLKRVTIKFDGNDVYYHVFRYMTNEPHWASKNGWMLGVVGPYFDDSKPYDFPAATFSRCSSKVGEIEPEDEAKWVHENIALKR
ncbi:hypothetical protein [Salinimicrobium sediminilitoris]|uniref:hypothetical protein n=1 Tax=Salinimicrobium sediminilitoris TaxID=2876715 RepID=UPI001E2B7B8E|nr:hypothetical protein [Salinimicrobium sediminilitoris]MCC8358933.1 hypothetical protein [Salinimicrobium sediminilitoris]